LNLGLESIRAVILDVDGVLTDGSIYVGDDGAELKRFHSWDGAGIKYLLRSGVQVALLSGRRCEAVEHRARQLGITHVRQDAKDKLPAYEELLEELGLTDEVVCYVGDDLADIPVLRRAGLAVAVADARPEVRAIADEVTEAPGGHGAVRELAERLLKSQGKWEAILSRYSP
jgi:3-deoxy-D-manno-octulosonate 8-phosphate phosphatase (KDO 8-P phosphatase)